MTVQKVCRAAKDEDEVREALDLMWKTPGDGEKILGELTSRNEELYGFEKMLEETDSGEKAGPILSDEESQ